MSEKKCPFGDRVCGECILFMQVEQDDYKCTFTQISSHLNEISNTLLDIKDK